MDYFAGVDIGSTMTKVVIVGDGIVASLIGPTGPEHRKLAEQIREHGAIVSDYAPGTKPDGINFPPRNRIISGLSCGL